MKSNNYLRVWTKEQATEIRKQLKEALGIALSVKKGSAKYSTIINIAAPKKQDYLFTEEQAKTLTNKLAELGLVTCLGDPFKEEDWFLYRSQIGVSQWVIND
jgi:hypothetical protein